MPLLDIRNLNVDFASTGGTLRAVDGVTLQIEQGDVLGIVGESGSGKSVSMMAMMGLVPFPGRVTADTVSFEGRDLLHLPERERRKIVGKDIAMIFQEPTTSLNPSFTIGYQLTETLRMHEGMDRKAAKRRAVDLLSQVGIPSPEGRLKSYPHQMSGGMNQRVMIAMAIACNPKLLIADEPTTALDVTIQAQILDLLLSLQRDRKMALILITHNMGVVADTVDRVAVMYAGQIVEERDTASLFRSPQHPYTAALMAARPEASDGGRLATIPGVVPGLYDRPRGCLFGPRCTYATPRTDTIRPELRDWQDGRIRCHYPLGDPTRDARIAADRVPTKAVS
ncbi:MAG TPA: ABC transporter ATP-binding protein [Pseudorhodoplanes sp.]|nr:ABC transporter ATP-binding protein [Pseudorhodoplanes sp.]